MKVGRAAAILHNWLFGRNPKQVLGTVSVGFNQSFNIHVYIKANYWHAEQIKEFEGYQVTWHLNCEGGEQ
jgi:hypothetical protein